MRPVMLNAPYTDIAVAVGPNLRWAIDDTEDLMRAYPEVFLGLRVHMDTVDNVARGKIIGMRVSKFVVFDGSQRERKWSQAWLTMKSCISPLTKTTPMEYWHVHRGTGIYRMDV